MTNYMINDICDKCDMSQVRQHLWHVSHRDTMPTKSLKDAEGKIK
jgi:hypothetical protein